MAKQIEAVAGKVSDTSTGVVGAKDVDVTVTIDGVEYEGEVTLAEDEINGGWRAYGNAPDYWVSGNLLSQLRALDHDDFRAALNEIEAAAAAEC